MPQIGRCRHLRERGLQPGCRGFGEDPQLAALVLHPAAQGSHCGSRTLARLLGTAHSSAPRAPQEPRRAGLGLPLEPETAPEALHKEKGVGSPSQPLPPHPRLCPAHPPARLTLKVTASSRVSHTYSPASSGWAWGRVRVRAGPSAPSCSASDTSTSSPSLYQRTWDPAGATSQRSSTCPGAPNCKSKDRAAGCTILSGGAGGWAEKGAHGFDR